MGWVIGRGARSGADADRTKVDNEALKFIPDDRDSLPSAAVGDPRSYPWTRPAGSFHLDPATGHHRALRPGEAAPLAVGRHPLLAVGANAAPTRLADKCGPGPPVAVVAVDLADHDAVYAARQAGHGAVPATLHASPGTRLRTHVALVDGRQRAAIDRSEAVPDAYEVVDLDPALVTAVDVAVDLGPVVHAYRATAGALEVDGAPRALASLRAVDRRWPAWSEEQVLAWVGAQLGRTIDEVVDRRASRSAVDALLRAHRNGGHVRPGERRPPDQQ